MKSSLKHFIDIVEQTLRFEYQCGDVTRVTYPHDTGWRTLSSLVTACVTYPAIFKQKKSANVLVDAYSTLCIPPGVHHRIEMASQTSGISRWSHVNFWILEGMDIFTIIKPPLIIKGPIAKQIGDFNESLAFLYKKPVVSLQEVIQKKSLSISLLEQLVSVSELRSKALPMLENSFRFTPVLEYIRHNLKENLGRDVLAKITNLSLSRFDALFKTTLGISPQAYVQKLRLQNAQRLLLKSTMSVKEISSNVGYKNPLHFSKIFKQYFSVSPLHYRKQTGQSH